MFVHEAFDYRWKRLLRQVKEVTLLLLTSSAQHAVVTARGQEANTKRTTHADKLEAVQQGFFTKRVGTDKGHWRDWLRNSRAAEGNKTTGSREKDWRLQTGQMNKSVLGGRHRLLGSLRKYSEEGRLGSWAQETQRRCREPDQSQQVSYAGEWPLWARWVRQPSTSDYFISKQSITYYICAVLHHCVVISVTAD